MSDALVSGRRIGPYEITGALGAGGMGEVFRARDTKLNRHVAIKVLPAAFADDPERLARFTREAQSLAALNHPNIATIYGIEEIASSAASDDLVAMTKGAGASRALVMELVEGEDLSAHLARGPIPINEALPIARQIAEALEAAHEQGIVHRDLKPANIKVRADGTVKVLDFGLAKAMDPGGASSSNPNVSHSPTLTHQGTSAGMIIGTAAYMSPEQAKGKAVDKRADIWAFGVVLYEMLTGKRAFRGEDVSETLASVLKDTPSMDALPATAPLRLRRLIERCLERDLKTRLRDIGEARVKLARIESGVPDGVASTPGAAATAAVPGWRRATPWALAAAAGLAAVVLAVPALRHLDSAAPRVTRFTITPSGVSTITAIGADRELSITPDGGHIVYVGHDGTQLFLRAMDQLEPIPLASGNPRGPFVSPDGQWVGFFEVSSGVQAINKVAITGGPALSICPTKGQRQGATWSEDGTIIYATADPASGLWRVPSAGGEPTQLTTPDHERGESDHVFPEFLPGGQAVLFTITSTTGGIETAQVAVLDLKNSAYKIVVRGGSHAHYVSSGHLVYGVAGTLRAVAFDLRRLEATGTPVPVLTQVVTTNSGAADFDVARDGTLIYVPKTRTADDDSARTLVWVDRRGREEPIKAPARAYVSPRISPDGTRLAVDVRDQEDDIWIWNFAGETLTRVTFDPGRDSAPVWTPDGRRLAFSSTRDKTGLGRVFWQVSDGTGNAEPLGHNGLPSSISPDGAHLLFSQDPLGGFNAVNMLMLDKDRRFDTLVQSSNAVWRNGEVSPDGRWLAYEGSESGPFQIHVRPFPDVNRGHWQVSTAGGRKPSWARSGRELFYAAPTGALMSVRVDAGRIWKAGDPTKVFEGQYYAGPANEYARTYDVSPDGQRFLMVKPSPSDLANLPAALVATGLRATEEGLVVVQHWDEELKRLMGVRK